MKNKNKLLILLTFYLLLHIYLGGWWHEVVGYWGLQDAVRYQKAYEFFRSDCTHWMTIYIMDIFGLRWWPMILGYILLPFAFKQYYGTWKQVYQFYLYSPLILLILVQNVYSQLLFTFFFVLYLKYHFWWLQIMAMLAHPAFTIILILENFLERKMLRGWLLVLAGILVLIFTPLYEGYNILNVGGDKELSLFNTLLYMNPVNILFLTVSPHKLIYTFVGLFFHNGRFLIYACMLQYIHEPNKWGKRYGLFINFLALYGLYTIV